MSDWWESAYKGGPMVPLPGFPRPLYPPDAEGHRASVDGPDVLAYKRTVSRAGRWPWQSFDDSFSNGFSHGSGPNVVDTGIAGVQRQQGIDDTGFVGKNTFNTLRSIRVPEGKPHAGAMAMDAKAQALLVEAWEMFGGEEPEPVPEVSVRTLAHKLAVGEIGTKESPPNSNQADPYTDWYGMVGPWCAMFVSWCYEQAGPSPSFQAGVNYAYVPYIVDDARSRKNGLSLTSAPVAGDLVCFSWDWDDVYDHVGIFEEWSGGRTFFCVEGNTAQGNDSDGGEVMRRSRDAGSQSTLFVRVAEP